MGGTTEQDKKRMVALDGGGGWGAMNLAGGGVESAYEGCAFGWQQGGGRRARDVFFSIQSSIIEGQSNHA